MTDTDPWQTAEIAGTKKAVVLLKPVVAQALIFKAKNPVLLIGHNAAVTDVGGKKLIDYLLDLALARNIPIIATGHSNRALKERGYSEAVIIPAVEAGQRIADPDWKGPKGKGPSDLVIVAGLPYPMTWTLLSGLRHFACHVKTITLDNTYQPNANWSFANISVKEWQESLQFLIDESPAGGLTHV